MSMDSTSYEYACVCACVCICTVAPGVHVFIMQLVYGSCILIGEVNKQESTVKLKGTLSSPVLISVQSSPGALLLPDEWRLMAEEEEEEDGGGAAVPTKVR